MKSVAGLCFLLIAVHFHICAAENAFPEKDIELKTGIRTRYVEIGKEDGEAVLFLHGYTDTKRSFYPLLTHLNRLRPDLRLIAIDQRGHGGSTMPREDYCPAAPERCFRFVDLAADVLAFLEAKGIARAGIVGHSMGSLAAQQLALTVPNRITNIVLLATATDLRNNPVVRDFLRDELVEGRWKEALLKKGQKFPEDAYMLMPPDADPDSRKWFAENWVVEPLADPAFLSDVLPETNAIRLGTWIGCIRTLLQVNNTERLRELEVPALVLWATQDNIFTREDQEMLRKSLSAAAQNNGTRYFWKQYGKKPLPESGVPDGEVSHNMHWGAASAVAADIAAFLKKDGTPVVNLPFGDRGPDGHATLAIADQQAVIVYGTPDH